MNKSILQEESQAVTEGQIKCPCDTDWLLCEALPEHVMWTCFLNPF